MSTDPYLDPPRRREVAREGAAVLIGIVGVLLVTGALTVIAWRESTVHGLGMTGLDLIIIAAALGVRR